MSSQMIIRFITAIVAIFMKDEFMTRWRNMLAGDKQAASDDTPKKKDKVEIPKDYEGDPAMVNIWIQWMMLYFQEKKIENNWKNITITLPKIKKEKDNQAQ
ncbi:hypothetical protein BDQ17DRAFT_1430197 [Cyathus striatus]|nr:hypothetical protein BDQ17DRAFT_1430197 [Cyathus striatus]